MYALLVLALVASASATASDSRCPEPKPVDNFDFKRYGQGLWYELARYPNKAEPATKANCGTAEYTPEGDIIKVKNYHVVDHKPYYIEGTGRITPGAGTLGKITFTLPYGPNGSPKDAVFNVLATDYDNYSIGYYCDYDEEKKTYRDFAWVLSRHNKIEGEAKSFVDSFFKSSKLLDNSRLYWNDFSESTCKLEN